MLDKSIPFHSIIMKREYEKMNNEIILPDGYSIRSYEDGDEKYWAKIEKAVLEFDTEEDALNCFKYYKEHIEDLKKRQFYVLNENNIPVATATIWKESDEFNNVPVVHAFACLPEYQGKGLGRAVLTQMVQVSFNEDKNKPIWIETQTWSYHAVALYLSLGFKVMKKEVFNNAKNEYDNATKVLEKVMYKDAFNKWLQNSI